MYFLKIMKKYLYVLGDLDEMGYSLGGPMLGVIMQLCWKFYF